MNSPKLPAFTLTFTDPGLERAYRAVEDAKALRLTRVGLAGGMVMFLVAGLAIEGLSMGGLREIESARLWSVAGLYWAFSALAYLATHSAPFRRNPQIALAGLLIGASAGIAWMLRFLPAEFAAHRGFMFVVLNIFTLYGLLRLRMLPAMAAGWGSVLIYAVVVKAQGTMDDMALARQLFWLVSSNLWGMLICYQIERSLRREYAAGAERDREHARAERLLLSILPGAVAERLKSGPQTIAEHAGAVTVLFADLVGFTPLAARKQPVELVALLDQVFGEFDQLAQDHGLEKIKTIGDAYMAVAGLPDPQADHALRAARMALAMVETVKAIGRDSTEPLQLRVGLHSGAVVAGVIGRSKFSYDLWGDTVNLASRMESLGVPGKVQCTAETAELLDGRFVLEERGEVEVKGKGFMQTYFLRGGAAP